MDRLLKSILAAAAAGGTAVLLARLLRPEPPSPPAGTGDEPFIDADAFTDDERRMLMAELGAYTGGENT